MLLFKITELPGIFSPEPYRLKTPIRVVSDEPVRLSRSVTGSVHYRHKNLTYSLEEYEYRLNTVVSLERYPYADAAVIGVPLIYFIRGKEGLLNGLIGLPSSEDALLSSHSSHLRHRDERLQQMKDYYYSIKDDDNR